MTYKILYNDVVAMTGGQKVEGVLHPANMAAQLVAEGVSHITIVSPDPERWQGHDIMPKSVRFAHRDDLENVQTQMRDIQGVSVIIYDQACATEMRRRRKRGTVEAPKARIFINEKVCEGCGDCSKQSNCIAIGPKETDYGRKREIDQSACNIDASCVRGFCPSFVAVKGQALKKAGPMDIAPLLADLSEPQIIGLGKTPYNILLAGIGGLGVTSLSAMMGMAAHIDGLEVSVVDQLGMAQRGGGVTAHIRIGAQGQTITGPRIAMGESHVLLAMDQITAHGKVTLPLLSAAKTKGFLNEDLISTAEFTENTLTQYNQTSMIETIRANVQDLALVDVNKLCKLYLGDSVYGNMMLLGLAWQSGAIPLSREAIFAAIRLNGAEIEMNINAFGLGRAYYLGRMSVPEPKPEVFDLDAFIGRRNRDLIDYQDQAYAARYQALVDKAIAAESRLTTDRFFSEAVARQAYRLMAYKDEYEVARLYSDLEFKAQLAQTFATSDRVSVYLAPPLLAPKDKATGLPQKMEFGPFVFSLFKILKGFKFLRGTGFDLFGYSEERRMERQMRETYFALIEQLCNKLDATHLNLATELAQLPDMVKGFGHIKAKNKDDFDRLFAQKMAQYNYLSPSSSSPSPLKETLHV